MFSEWLQQTWLRLKTLWKRPELDRDLGEEVAFHLAMREEKNRLAGVDPEEARYAARRQFGNTSALKENSREVWTFAALESFCQDLRFGARTLRKNCGFSAVAFVTLALGIAANVTVFSFVD